MIKCLIVEDEPLAVEILEKYVVDHPDTTLIGKAFDCFTAEKLLNSKEVDLLLLDINLPKLSGLDFYRNLRSKPNVIFTTAYSEFAVDGFEVDALDYLVKPISFQRFSKAISRFTSLPKTEDQNHNPLIVRSESKQFRIDKSTIKLIESLGDYIKIHTHDRTFVHHMTMKIVLTHLPSYFKRAHKSYIVNLNEVEFMEGNRLNVSGITVPIGYSYRSEFTKYFK